MNKGFSPSCQRCANTRQCKAIDEKEAFLATVGNWLAGNPASKIPRIRPNSLFEDKR
ncbi:MAG TPA: hypothetical protein VMF08_13045 [Candidatus Sulfotelmatobacter sp.]|nr:hypothetical protein [Candidatus Sulfotelmatobacter sp.]